MSCETPAARVAVNLRHARENLLAGRGPGASEQEVAAHTRNRAVIAGESATRRLALAARDTTRARCDADGLADTIQLASGELAHSLTLIAERLRPGHLTRTVATQVIARVRAHPAPFALVGVALVVHRTWARASSAQDPPRR